MFPEHGWSAPARRRAGFALPLAVFALLIVMLLVAVILDAAVSELRAARGGLAAARSSAAVQSALAGLVDETSDSVWTSGAIGAARTTVTAADGDTVSITLQRLGSGFSRAVVHAVSRAGGIVGAAGAVAFIESVPDSVGAVSVHFRRLPGWWWVPAP